MQWGLKLTAMLRGLVITCLLMRNDMITINQNRTDKHHPPKRPEKGKATARARRRGGGGVGDGHEQYVFIQGT